jgi:hypothetical protein
MGIFLSEIQEAVNKAIIGLPSESMGYAVSGLRFGISYKSKIAQGLKELNARLVVGLYYRTRWRKYRGDKYNYEPARK